MEFFNIDVEEKFNEFRTEARSKAAEQFGDAKKWRRLSLGLAIAASILALGAGGLGFTDTANTAAAVIAVAAAIVSAISPVISAPQKAEKARSLASGWSWFIGRVDLAELTLQQDDGWQSSPKAIEAYETLRKQYDQLVNEQVPDK